MERKLMAALLVWSFPDMQLVSERAMVFFPYSFHLMTVDSSLPIFHQHVTQ